MKKGTLWTIGFSTALIAFTAYISLDTFVLSSVYQTDATEQNTSMFSETSSEYSFSSSSYEDEEYAADSEENTSNESSETSSTEGTKKHGHISHSSNSSDNIIDEDSNSLTDSVPLDSNSYQDDNINITITEYYENNTKIYVADVRLTSAQYLKAAFAEDTYGKNVTEKTSEIAAAHNAILAINGDYYGAQESGYVIRNGIVYRDEASDNDILCIYADGSMEIMSSDEKTADELVSDGVWQAFSFGPGLVENGEITVTVDEEVGKAKASNPRTAIGIIDNCHYVFVVADGRTSESAGLSLYQLAEFMQGLGVATAYNLDGGGSSTMYFNGAVVNNPTSSGNSIKEREVSDIVYIG